MPSRRVRSLLAVTLAASLLLACSKESEPAASGVSTTTPTPAASAPEAPKATATATATATAPAPATSQTEAALVKGLLLRSDVPGSGWTIVDLGVKDLADATKSAGAQQSAQVSQDLIAACYPNQPAAPANTVPPDSVARFFAMADGVTSVMSMVSKTADAQASVKLARETRAEDLRGCMQDLLQKTVSAQIPGAKVELVQATSLTGLPSNAGGTELVIRASASGVALTQHLASISAAQGDLLGSVVIVAMAEGTAIPPLPAAPAALGTAAAQRLAEAAR